MTWGALATGGIGFGGPPAPALALTVAFSYASFTLAFRTSASPSINAFNGRSPTIFIKVPKQTAASSRAPANPSSKRAESGSVTDFSCAGGSGVVDVDKHLLKNLSVPSFT